jgi:DNA modification methylase
VIYRDRIKELKRVRASDLIPSPHNWRRHPQQQEDALRAVLTEVGYADAVLVREVGDGLEIIDGHLRSSLEGNQEIPVLVLDVSEEEAKQLLLTLDPLAAMAQTDVDALTSLLADVTFNADSITSMLDGLLEGGFEPLTPKEAFPSAEEDEATASDAIDKVEADNYVPFSKRGQVWALGEHRLMCGDSADSVDVSSLWGNKNPDLIVTDPPYGVAYAESRNRPKYRSDRLPIENDALGAEQKEWWQSVFSAWPVPGDWYVFTAPGPLSAEMAAALVAAGVSHRQWLIWSKDQFVLGGAHFHYRHENIFYGWRNKSTFNGQRDLDSVWDVPRSKDSKEHPTMKPVALCEQAITASSVEEMVVAEPFAGAGSTIIASEKLGRRCYAMEIEPRYVDVCIKRWEAFTGKQAKVIA